MSKFMSKLLPLLSKALSQSCSSQAQLEFMPTILQSSTSWFNEYLLALGVEREAMM